MPLVHACAVTADRASPDRHRSPQLLTAAPHSTVGGQALFRGHIEIRGRCIVAVGPTGQTSLPIFDATVSLNDTSDGIVDARSGVHISIGQQFRAGAATFRRDNGKGWSLADIKQATGVSVPNGCGSTIVMLRDIEAGPEPARRTDTAR
jgi:hypothetical protein